MNVAFIPVRGGSKSIPLKNIKVLNGRPLVYWTVKAACKCSEIDTVYVSTDSDEIKKVVEAFSAKKTGGFEKVKVIGRSAQTASDTASTESAMLEFARKYEFDNIVLIQATSPMLEGEDLDRGFEIYNQEDTDSVLSAVAQKRFFWDVDDKGIASPTNYDVYKRPRRQDFKEYYVENGAFYITSRERLLKSSNRVSGNIKISPMSEDSFYEIDEPSDWIVVESLMKKREESRKIKSYSEAAETKANVPVQDVEAAADEKKCRYKMFLTDCDGCLTDGGMYYSEKGDELKKFNTKDGMGFKLLRERGIVTGVITGEDVALNRRRCEKLKLDILAPGCVDKETCVKDLCARYGIDLSEVVYVGDDINDKAVLEMVGLGCCPSNANSKVKSSADYIAEAKGGEGVIREIVDMILE